MNLSYDTISVETNEGVTTLRFNRPEKKNAMSPTLHREMHDALTKLALDPDTGVLVVTGSGDSFSAGQDLKEYFYELKDSPGEREQIRHISHEWRHQKLYNFPKPTIAAINGWCFGGAFTVVASCDIAVAADDAVFGLSEVNFGNIPGGLVAKVVADLMVPRQALYYVLTGDHFDGKRSVDIGFTTLSVPLDQLEQQTLQIASKLLGKDAHAVRACKEVFKGVNLKGMHHEEAWYWLSAKVEQLTLQQKGGWIEEGIGRFMKGDYRPGLESMPKANDS
jgi:trans-feruloyl-CoA hydratase/vanillin synthase